jgi:hypothetical protein
MVAFIAQSTEPTVASPRAYTLDPATAVPSDAYAAAFAKSRREICVDMVPSCKQFGVAIQRRRLFAALFLDSLIESPRTAGGIVTKVDFRRERAGRNTGRNTVDRRQ